MNEFAPCPTCSQYSHSIGDGQITAAFSHFQSMISHRGDGIPTQFLFDEATRDAAQALLAAVWKVEWAEKVEREIARLISSSFTNGRKAGLEEAAKIAETLAIGGGTLSSWINTNESPMGATKRHIATAIRARGEL